MSENLILQQLPHYLKSFIIEQPYHLYTPRDQAVWRYVMRKNITFLKNRAHSAYRVGLTKTGIGTDHIPTIEEMNRHLGKIGWAATCVDGFIPPAAFMAFQQYHVLPIAADIRSIDQIKYTPAPDILHEAAGHAPLIVDEEYAGYLVKFGEIGSRAFSSKTDYKLYEAIRHLSILKANHNSSKAVLDQAENALDELKPAMGVPSEMALIRNLHWWTVEYGLIGRLTKPKIYGAGLLSSIAESKLALSDTVEKIPYTLDAMDYSFDITRPQPQLFVTPNFGHITEVLEAFARQMALHTGGVEGILKAIASGNTGTLVYSSGLQVSGTFTDILIHEGNAVYMNTTGPTALSYGNKILPGHAPENHLTGFGGIIGKLKNTLKPIRLLTDQDLYRLGIEKGKHCRLTLDSDVQVTGTLLRVTRKEGKIVLMHFTDCTVTHLGRTLFEPSWGIYDMAVGEKIISAFSGAANPDSFGFSMQPPQEKTQRIKYSKQEKELFRLYEQAGTLRTGNHPQDVVLEIYKKVKDCCPDEWLLLQELREQLNK